MNILQIIIDILTYTPTFYVDGIPCNVDCAWVGAVIGLIGSAVGAGMSASASASSASKTRRAAKKNYNMLMENAEMSKMTLNEQMDRYEEDMDSYRSSMIQRYGLAGGVRGDNAGLKEVQNYQFDTDTKPLDITTLKEEYDKKWREENSDKNKWVEEQVRKAERDYNSHLSNKQIEENEFWSSSDERGARASYSREYDKLYGAPSKAMSDKDWTDKLGNALLNYQGKQTNWQNRADNSAILNLQTSVTNMQKDINNAYKAGMIEYWQQRKNAQNVKDTLQTQAIGYSTAAAV